MRIVDHYKVLQVQPSSSKQQIRDSYRKLAILEHPDRSTAKDATRRFQIVNDAFVVLSNDRNRREYDAERRSASLYNPFDGQDEPEPQSNANNVFGTEFEDLLRPEVEQQGWVFGLVGAGAGAVIGFIIFNVPGSLVGLGVGRWLGSLRDRHGKAVLSVFMDLPQNQRAAILAALAKKVFDTGMGAMK